MRPLDLKALIESTQKVITLKTHDQLVRRVSRTEFQSLLLPTRPAAYPEWEKAADYALADLKDLSKDERANRRVDLLTQYEVAWLESLSSAERITRSEDRVEGFYRIVARATLDPVLTVDQVKRLGDEAFTILAGIQSFWAADEQAEKNGTLVAVESAV
jgi:hypothetical protein